LRKKAIVIGLDGLEPAIVDAMLARGELPNLVDRDGHVAAAYGAMSLGPANGLNSRSRRPRGHLGVRQSQHATFIDYRVKRA